LASAHASLDRFGVAETLFERKIAEDRSSPHAYLNLGLVLVGQGETRAAMEWWRKMRVDASASTPKVSYAIRRN